MTLEEMRKLKPGDAIRHKGDANGYIVTANYLSRVTAVRTADITNPAEWDLAPQPNKIEEKINWIPAGVRVSWIGKDGVCKLFYESKRRRPVGCKSLGLGD
jgi:hypothetical protein